MNANIQALEKQFRQTITEIEQKLHSLQQTISAMAQDERAKEKQSQERDIYSGLLFRRLLNGSEDSEGFRKAINSSSMLLLPEITPTLSASQLSLITRAYRGLFVKTGLATIGDLAMQTEYRLLCYRNVGKRSLKLIKLGLEHNGLSLGMSFNPELQDPTLQIPIRDLLKGIHEKLKEEILDCLNQWMPAVEGYTNIGKVSGFLLFTEEQLLTLPGFGPQHLKIIKKRLESVSVSLPKHPY